MSNRYPLTTIYLYLTEYCNLNCMHCWINPKFIKQEKKNGGVNYRDLQKGLIEAKKIGLKSVKLTGGEPFLYSRILDLLKWLNKNSLNITIETNGTLIGEKESKVMKEAGVSHIAISLDGSSDKIHKSIRSVEGSFERTINGIKKVVEKGLNLQIIFSLWKGNRKDLKNTIILAKKLGAKSFKINPISHISRGQEMEKKGKLLSLEEVLSLRKFIADLSEKLNFRIILDIPLAFKSLSVLRKSMATCGIKNILGILSDGSISICGIGTIVKELVLGNISTDSIVDVWNSSEILRSIREELPDRLEGVCGKCVFRHQCLGKCVAAAYWSEKSFFSPFHFCQEAFEKGLFPNTRIYEKEKSFC